MIDVYKYIHGIYKTQQPQFSLNKDMYTRGNTLKIIKQQHRLNLRGIFFTQRVVNTWNSLPDSVVTAPSMNTFKARLDSFWKSLPTVYDPECYQ